MYVTTPLDYGFDKLAFALLLEHDRDLARVAEAFEAEIEKVAGLGQLVTQMGTGLASRAGSLVGRAQRFGGYVRDIPRAARAEFVTRPMTYLRGQAQRVQQAGSGLRQQMSSAFQTSRGSVAGTPMAGGKRTIVQASSPTGRATETAGAVMHPAKEAPMVAPARTSQLQASRQQAAQQATTPAPAAPSSPSAPAAGATPSPVAAGQGTAAAPVKVSPEEVARRKASADASRAAAGQPAATGADAAQATAKTEDVADAAAKTKKKGKKKNKDWFSQATKGMSGTQKAMLTGAGGLAAGGLAGAALAD